ncbi:MAG: RDD family protein [Paracoccaceae bacterium]
MTPLSLAGDRSALPDPAQQPDFYENVPLKRLFAWLVDAILVFAICVVLLPFTGFTGLFFWPFYFLTVDFFYRLATVIAFSATPGMALLAVRLYGHDGDRLDRMTAFLHVAGYSVSTGAVLPMLVSATLMLVSPRRQGLTDMILGTAALNRPARR